MLGHEQRCYKVWVAVGALLLGVLVAATALAQQSAVPSGPSPQKESLLTPEDHAAMGQIFWHRVQERLGLTDQQVTDIRSLLQAQRTASRADVQSLIAARRQLRTLLEQPTSDPAAIQGMATQLKALQSKLFDDRPQTQLALRGKFTSEQWQGWLALRKGWGHRWMRRGGTFGRGA